MALSYGSVYARVLLMALSNTFQGEKCVKEFVKVAFFVLTGIQFPTSFPCCCQTWENEENEFQELVFLETNTALVPFPSPASRQEHCFAVILEKVEVEMIAIPGRQ
jgi:hypothetical protein